MNVKTTGEIVANNTGDVITTEHPIPLENTGKVDYEKLVNTSEFKKLVKRKNGFLTPYVIFFCLAYALLPILTSYTSILENSAIGSITWTWMYSFGMFVMVWTLATIYTKKASSFDKDVEEILTKNNMN